MIQYFVLTKSEMDEAERKHDLISKIDKGLNYRDRRYSKKKNTVMGYRAEKAFEKYCKVSILTQTSIDPQDMFHPDYVCLVPPHKGEYIELKANGAYAYKKELFYLNVIKGYYKARRDGATILVALVEVKKGTFIALGWLPITENIEKYKTIKRGRRKAFLIPLEDFKPLEEVAPLKR